MGYERREFTGGSSIVYAIERHTGGIQEEQRCGRLRSQRVVLEELQEVEEEGLRWYLLYLRHSELSIPYLRRTILFSGDCDEKVIKGLAPNEILTKIESSNPRPDICFGRENSLVAAVLTEDGRVVYKSPGFDLEAYMQKQSLRNKNNEHEK